MPIAPERIVGPDLMDIYAKVAAGVRLTLEDGVRLYEHPNLTGVGYMANIVRERLHGTNTYYVRNQHINYTNICNKFCKFCSFYAKKGGPDPYEYSIEEVRRRLNWHKDVEITEVHMVGGINPRLPYQYYLDLCGVVKEVFPHAHVKAFTAIEIEQIAKVGKVSIAQALRDLVEAGLDSLPGGGIEIEQIAKVGKVSIAQALRDLVEAGLDSLPGGGIEILSDRVHQELFGRKMGGEGWKEVAREASRIGLKQYATMLYGHIETHEERANHLIQLRDLQDETGHFLTFTPLSFHPEETELADVKPQTGFTDLRNIAVARLMLDNFDHIKSFWIMNTPEVTQASLWYGADDTDGLVHEYEITYKEGDFGNKKQALTYRNMCRMIEEAGRIPIERDSLYQEIKREVQPESKRRLTPLPMG